MILYCHCVKDSKPNNSLCMKHSRGKYCNDRVLLNMIEEAITFCISLPGCFFFFFLSSAFFSSFSDGRKFDHIKPCLSSFSIPWGASAAESPRDNKGKNIKAHKQDTHTHTQQGERRENVCTCRCAHVCVHALRLTLVYANDSERACVHAYTKSWSLEHLPAAVVCALWVAGSATFFLVVSNTHACSTHTHTLPVLHPT